MHSFPSRVGELDGDVSKRCELVAADLGLPHRLPVPAEMPSDLKPEIPRSSHLGSSLPNWDKSVHLFKPRFPHLQNRPGSKGYMMERQQGGCVQTQCQAQGGGTF